MELLQLKCLPHEGWHAVQQMQGRVRPTRQLKGVSINEAADLEREADGMGTKAFQRRRSAQATTGSAHQGSTPVQRQGEATGDSAVSGEAIGAPGEKGPLNCLSIHRAVSHYGDDLLAAAGRSRPGTGEGR